MLKFLITPQILIEPYLTSNQILKTLKIVFKESVLDAVKNSA